MKKLFIVCWCFLLAGCNFFTQYTNHLISNEKLIDIEPSELHKDEERKWTILVYMSGDNNLETSAFEDIYEMESSDLNTDEVTVLFLLDRSPSYNASNGNWSGTRLYKLCTGRGESQKNIISTELDCKELGLIAGVDTELDMSDGNVLSSLIEFARFRYPATHYGLIMWGHGSGWKNENENLDFENLYKGFAYDETSDSYLSLKNFGHALKQVFNDTKLDFLGFDTCYGAELEVMYEIRKAVEIACGSEGLISSAGWNYNLLFNEFQKYENKSIEELCSSVSYQFSKQYASSLRASFCVCNLEHMDAFFTAFDSFMKKCSELITSVDIRDDIFSLIYMSLESPVSKYTYGKEGYDIYFDVYSLCKELNTYFCNEDLEDCYQIFLKAYENLILQNWSSDSDAGGIGVYFQTLGPGNLLLTNYNSNYIKGKTLNQIDFVSNSTGYIPCVKTSESFIDKLFYHQF